MHRPDIGSIGAAGSITRALIVAHGAVVAAADPSPDPSATGMTLFESNIMPYALVLPAGWSAVAESQEPGSTEDWFSTGELSARVGYGVPEPGEQVEDRVA